MRGRMRGRTRRLRGGGGMRSWTTTTSPPSRRTLCISGHLSPPSSRPGTCRRCAPVPNQGTPASR
eukprot:370947-Pyramimonas_sp.AAC.1